MSTRETQMHDRRMVLKQAAVLGALALLGSLNRASQNRGPGDHSPLIGGS